MPYLEETVARRFVAKHVDDDSPMVVVRWQWEDPMAFSSAGWAPERPLNDSMWIPRRKCADQSDPENL